jgi:hypothetical protein
MIATSPSMSALRFERRAVWTFIRNSEFVHERASKLNLPDDTVALHLYDAQQRAAGDVRTARA